MTSYLPSLEGHAGPRYRAIAQALMDDIAAGKLVAGTKLPTHRDLAWRLGVTVGTVTRAYSELERRGLIAGEVGRGTFVKPAGTPNAGAARYSASMASPQPSPGIQDLSGNAPPPPPLQSEIAEAFSELATDPAFEELLRYRPPFGIERHRAIGAALMTERGVATAAEDVLPCNGAQHGNLLAVASVVRPGDVVLCEALTWFGLKSVANALDIRLVGVEMDEHGIIPEALDEACRAHAARLLYTIPTLQNPMLTIMPAERREEIAEICRRRELMVIEDDIYAFLIDDAPRPLASYLPEQTILVTSLSKSVAPALRCGYLRAPKILHGALASNMKASSIMASPLLHEIGARLVENGTAAANAALIREEMIARTEIAREILADCDARLQPTAFHAWLTLPEPWRRESYAAAARQRGISVSPADAFAVGRQPVPHAVRIGLSSPRTRDELSGALRKLRDLLGARVEEPLPSI